MGSIYQRGAAYWIQYRPTAGSFGNRAGARRKAIPRVERITVGELLDGLTQDYAANARRSADRLTFSLAHLRPTFATHRAVHVTAADVTKYVTARQAEGAANVTINRELAALKKGYTLALRAERIHRAPHIAMLEERNPRQGFFGRLPLLNG